MLMVIMYHQTQIRRAMLGRKAALKLSVRLVSTDMMPHEIFTGRGPAVFRRPPQEVSYFAGAAIS